MGLRPDRIASLLKIAPAGFSSAPCGSRSAIVIDSRKVAKGDAFVAIRGENHDGHDFITPELIGRASFIIVDRKWYARNRPSGTAFIPVPDTVKTMLKLAEARLRELKVKIVAITGSNGKTTTRAMIAKVLKTRHHVFETKGNFNNRIGLPLSVFELDEQCEVAVLEMGANHFGEIRELSRTVHPDLAVIINIGRGHLQFFKSRKGVLRAKTEILAGMRTGIFLANADDDLLKEFSPEKGIHKVTYGFNPDADFRGLEPSTDLFSGTRFTLAGGRTVRVPVAGRGAAQNALAAVAVGAFFGVPEKAAVRALAGFKPPSGRMELRRYRGAHFILDNYNANPDSLKNALDLMKDTARAARKIAVLGDMGELGGESVRFHREAGARVKESGVDCLLTLGGLGTEIARGARRAGLKQVRSFTDAQTLIRAVRKTVRKGDLVLIKGSHSMKMEAMALDLLKGRD